MTKLKKCKVCGDLFTPSRAMQKVCGWPSPCALTLVESVKAAKASRVAKADRKVTKEKLRAMETQPQAMKKAQVAFNTFIRTRDAGKLCISCDKPLPAEALGGAFDCGHYRSVGAAPHMRFHEDNAHGQCKHCNQYLAGNFVEYRKRLLKRIGQVRVEAVETDNSLKKYTRDELNEMAADFRSWTRGLK